MTEPFDPTPSEPAPLDPARYALDDDELDRLLTGALDLHPAGLERNPVAVFISEARQTTFAEQPKPSDSLAALFSRVPATRSLPIPPDIETATSVLDRPAGGVAGDGATGGAAGGHDTIVNGVGVDGIAINGTGVEGTALNGTVSGAGGGGDPAVGAPPEPPLVSDSFTVGQGPAPTRALPAQLYRPSMFEAIMQVIRPNGTKLLMGLSVLLVLLIAGQAVGLIGLPSGSDSQNVAGVDTSVEPAAPEEGTTSSTADSEAGGLSRFSTTVEALSSSTEPLEATTTAAPTTATTAAPSTQPTLATTTPTIVLSTTTVSTTPTTTTTIPETTTTSIVSSSDPSVTAPTSDTVTVTSTDPTGTTVEPVVTLVPGRPAVAPNDVPVGTYRAIVESPLGCIAILTHADGSQATLEAGLGTALVFELRVGSRVVIANGCPQTYSVTVN